MATVRTKKAGHKAGGGGTDLVGVGLELEGRDVGLPLTDWTLMRNCPAGRKLGRVLRTMRDTAR